MEHEKILKSSSLPHSGTQPDPLGADFHKTAPSTGVRSPLKGLDRVTTGRRLFLRGDGRSREARRYRSLLRGFRAALGHAPSLAEDALCRTAAAMSLRSEQIACDMGAGKTISITDLYRIANAISSCLQALGLLTPPNPELPKLTPEEALEKVRNWKATP